jgi:transcriptional regulator with XRE-family HTH domain
MTTNLTIGQRLRNARHDKKLTQQQLADRSGLTLQRIFKVEQGVVDSPTLRTVTALARGLGLTVSQLIGEEEGGNHKRIYFVLTYDVEKERFTPQKGVSKGPYSLWGLRRALRKLQRLGYETDRNTPSVLIFKRIEAGI